MIALIADLHGDADALDSIVALLPAQTDGVIVLGDVIGGRRDYEIVHQLEQMGAESLLGHREAAGLGLWNDFTEPAPKLDPTIRRILSKWPMQLQSHDATLVHGSARHPFRSDDGSIESAKIEWAHTDAPILFRAHSHRPMMMARVSNGSEDIITPSPIAWGQEILLTDQAQWIITLPAANRNLPSAGWALWEPQQRTIQFLPL